MEKMELVKRDKECILVKVCVKLRMKVNYAETMVNQSLGNLTD